MTATPTLLLTPHHARYRIAHDTLGWHILIAEGAFVRPDSFGYIKTWVHDPTHNPEAFRGDVDLLRAVIAKLCARPGERRKLFPGPHSETRMRALETVVDIANEVRHEGTIEEWIGRPA